jgi:hypothetical protein
MIRMPLAWYPEHFLWALQFSAKRHPHDVFSVVCFAWQFLLNTTRLMF